MELVGALRVLLHHRRAVAVGALVACCVGMFLLYSSRERTTGYATARVLIDAPNAPATDLRSEVAGTLAPRASLLADLMTTEAARAATARAAGLRASQVAIVGPAALAPPTVPVELAARTTEAARDVREPYVLSVSSDVTAPIATLQATGPDVAGTARLVDAGTEVLQTVIARREPTRAQIHVERLGTVAAGPVTERPSRAMGVIAAGLLFILWCGAVVVLAGLARHRRSAGSPAVKPASP